ncbi:hypothetical protein ACEWAA_22475 [Vibrio parahaemolyticus]
MSISEIAAWWGAIVASIVLIWDVYKWKTDGPKLNVLLAPNMKTFGDPERDDMTWVSITVTNVGSRPTTLKKCRYVVLQRSYELLAKKGSTRCHLPKPK